jgi:DNA (cytosine-5)-methyltransferase 1
MRPGRRRPATRSNRSSKRRRPTAIDLFSGCGGLTSGLTAAGFRVIAAVEKDEDAAASYAANHPKVLLYQQDIREVSPAQIRRDLGLRKGHRLDLIAGCPPCQGFTRLTENNGRRDPRNRLVRDFVRFVVELKPRACMMENVPGLLTRGKRYFRELENALGEAGYKVTHRVVELADYGVPQFRRRLVVLAARSKRIVIPQPTHGMPAKETKPRRKPWRTVQDAIGSLPPPPLRSDVLDRKARRRYRWHYARDVAAVVRRRLKHSIQNGRGRAALPPKLRLACHERRPDGYFDVYGAMEWDAPSPTITSGCTNASKGRFGHPDAPRPLTATEAALLQTFPRSYKFSGSGLESVAKQIGNALPRRFAKIVGKSVLKQLRLGSKRGYRQRTGRPG